MWKIFTKIQIQYYITGVGCRERFSLDTTSNDGSDNENDIDSIASLKQAWVKKIDNTCKARKIK